MHARDVLGRRHRVGQQVQPGHQRRPARRGHLRAQLRRRRAGALEFDPPEVRPVLQRHHQRRQGDAADSRHGDHIHRQRVLRGHRAVRVLPSASRRFMDPHAALRGRHHVDLEHDLDHGPRHVLGAGRRQEPWLDRLLRHLGDDVVPPRAVPDAGPQRRPCVAAAAQHDGHVHNRRHLLGHARVPVLADGSRRRDHRRPALQRHCGVCLGNHNKQPLWPLQLLRRRTRQGCQHRVRSIPVAAVLADVVLRRCLDDQQDIASADRHDRRPRRQRDVCWRAAIQVRDPAAGRRVRGGAGLQRHQHVLVGRKRYQGRRAGREHHAERAALVRARELQRGDAGRQSGFAAASWHRGRADGDRDLSGHGPIPLFDHQAKSERGRRPGLWRRQHVQLEHHRPAAGGLRPQGRCQEFGSDRRRSGRRLDLHARQPSLHDAGDHHRPCVAAG